MRSESAVGVLIRAPHRKEKKVRLFRRRSGWDNGERNDVNLITRLTKYLFYFSCTSSSRLSKENSDRWMVHESDIVHAGVSGRATFSWWKTSIDSEAKSLGLIPFFFLFGEAKYFFLLLLSISFWSNNKREICWSKNRFLAACKQSLRQQEKKEKKRRPQRSEPYRWRVCHGTNTTTSWKTRSRSTHEWEKKKLRPARMCWRRKPHVSTFGLELERNVVINSPLHVRRNRKR